MQLLCSHLIKNECAFAGHCPDSGVTAFSIGHSPEERAEDVISYCRYARQSNSWQKNFISQEKPFVVSKNAYAHKVVLFGESFANSFTAIISPGNDSLESTCQALNTSCQLSPHVTTTRFYLLSNHSGPNLRADDTFEHPCLQTNNGIRLRWGAILEVWTTALI